MRRLGSRSAALRQGRRGAAFVWFVMVAVPVLFFALSMAVDFTRIVIAGRQVATATEAAALAGAYQFEPGEAVLNTDKAVAVALETYCWSGEVGGLPLAGAAGADSCASSKASGTLEFARTSTSITVTSHYRVKGLLVVDWFNGGDYEPPPTVRTASICSSTITSGPTGGNCYRPQE